MEMLKRAAAGFGIELTDEELPLLEKYMDLLLERNKSVNLTAITEKDDVLIKHFLDSMTVVLSGRFKENVRVIDVGAGAGFPSLPLKIIRPDLKITMLDSLNKRVSFLNEVTAELELKDISAVHARAEDAAHGIFREGFDVGVARAVADLAVLSEYVLPFVRVGGCFIAMKGGNPETEIDGAKTAIAALGGKIADVKKLYIEDGGLSRTLIIIDKIKKTPSKYPRKAGKPAKEPLK